jgi:hypothetical protein
LKSCRFSLGQLCLRIGPTRSDTPDASLEAVMMPMTEGTSMLDSLIFAAVVAQGPNDLPDSQYRGAHYSNSERFERVRKCIMWRESRGNYEADGPYGSGAYQFIQSTWKHYATEAGYPEWADKRASNAPRYVQDEVFAFVLNPFPKRPGFEGLHHWSAVHALTIGAKVRDCV